MTGGIIRRRTDGVGWFDHPPPTSVTNSIRSPSTSVRDSWSRRGTNLPLTSAAQAPAPTPCCSMSVRSVTGAGSVSA